jgi:hypothetical protein
MLEKEQRFYLKHRDELRQKYAGRRIVIVNKRIVGVYDSDRTALDAMESYKPGTYMIKYIPVDPAEEVAVFSSPFVHA